jgi:hypothetical protein
MPYRVWKRLIVAQSVLVCLPSTTMVPKPPNRWMNDSTSRCRGPLEQPAAALTDVGIAVLYQAPRIRIATGRSLDVTAVRAVDAPTTRAGSVFADPLRPAGADAMAVAPTTIARSGATNTVRPSSFTGPPTASG